MNVSSPTGEGEKRGPEFATQAGSPLPLRPKRNQMYALGTHDMDSDWADQGRTDMKDDGKFTPITVVASRPITNDRSGTGEMDMRVGSKSPMQLKGKMNR